MAHASAWRKQPPPRTLLPVSAPPPGRGTKGKYRGSDNGKTPEGDYALLFSSSLLRPQVGIYLDFDNKHMRSCLASRRSVSGWGQQANIELADFLAFDLAGRIQVLEP